jgi:hypothetical protein
MRRTLSVVGFTILTASRVLGAPQTANAWTQEPAGYRGIAWGGSVEDARKAMDDGRGVTCTCGPAASRFARSCKFKAEGDPAKAPEFRTCFSSMDVGSVRVQDILHFENEKFADAYMVFRSDQFAAMHDVFVEKYGPPTATEEHEITTRAGGKFMNTSLTWTGPRVTIRLERYGTQINEGIANLSLNEYIARREAQSKEEAKKGAKSF